jgi:hypothetical protein
MPKFFVHASSNHFRNSTTQKIPVASAENRQNLTLIFPS